MTRQTAGRISGLGDRLAQCAGQAVWEVLLVTAVLVAGFWGLNWATGGEGVVAQLLDALHGWQHRHATILALPI